MWRLRTKPSCKKTLPVKRFTMSMSNFSKEERYNNFNLNIILLILKKRASWKGGLLGPHLKITVNLKNDWKSWASLPNLMLPQMRFKTPQQTINDNLRELEEIWCWDMRTFCICKSLIKFLSGSFNVVIEN